MQFFIFILFYFLRYSFFRQAADNVKDSETETNGIGTNMTNNFTETTMNETNKMEENLTMSCPDMGLCYEIEFTWDSEPITHTPIQVTLQSADQGLNVSVNATFFDDPPPPNSTEGQSYNGLWDYEVVEVFFLNDNDEYVEIEVAPHGQYLVLTLIGRRNVSMVGLPLNFTSQISEDNTTWSGHVTVPWEYFPPNVTKFNAYAIHGTGDNRTYEALYPVPQGAFDNPDFHNLDYFQPILFEKLLPEHFNNTQHNRIWPEVNTTEPEHIENPSVADNLLEYEIQFTWDSRLINHDPIKVTLQSAEQGLNVSVNATYFDDPPPPNSTRGEPYRGLWRHEVVEVFFLNEDDNYLQIEVSPHGQHLVLTFIGSRNLSLVGLPLSYTSEFADDNSTWSGDFTIPWIFFPPNVTKFNAFAIHGTDENRSFEALYPVPHGVFENPDFHNLDFFDAIPFEKLLPTHFNNTEHNIVWPDMTPTESEPEPTKPPPERKLEYEIGFTWDSRLISHDPTSVVLVSAQKGLNVTVSATYFNDPPPPESEMMRTFYGLLEYEVVELFFLNNKNEYLEIVVGPHEQYLVRTYLGRNILIVEGLPLKVTTEISPDNSTWAGEFTIPWIFFPPKVTKFNAYAIHGTGENRTHEALFPVPHGVFEGPDFHNLDFFSFIPFETILPDHFNNTQPTLVWPDF